MTKELTQEEKFAWCAGYLAAHGSITGRKTGASITLSARSRQNALRTFANYLGSGIRVNVSGDRARVTISGKRLHEVMTLVWDYLPVERKREYKEAREIAKAKMEYSNG